MPKTVLEKIAEGTEVSKEECVRSLQTHMSNFKTLSERFENDNKLFAAAPDETFKNICQNNMIACQDKQTKVNDVIVQWMFFIMNPLVNRKLFIIKRGSL